MIDASSLPYKENAEMTKKVVLGAHAAQITVEGELGRLVGEEGNIIVDDPEAAQTDPQQAKNFVEETGIDALAVSIGTAHGQYTFKPNLNISRLVQIKKVVDIPIDCMEVPEHPLSRYKMQSVMASAR